MLKYNAWGEEYMISLKISKYIDHGNLCIQMIDHSDGFPEPFANMTVNLGVRLPRNDLAFVDTNNLNGIEEFIIKNGLGEPYGLPSYSGFCRYPQYKFYLEKCRKHC